MNFIDIDKIPHEVFRALGIKLKRLKEQGKLPALRVDPATQQPYITLDDKHYPFEELIEREARDEALVAAAKIKLMKGKLLIYPLKEVQKSSVGIVVVTKDKDVPRRGMIVGVGPDLYIKKKTISSPVQVGDEVVYMSGAHHEVTLDKDKYVIIVFDDVIAKLKD